MTAPTPDAAAVLYPRCQQMYKLLEQTAGKNDRKTLEDYFLEPENEILGWKSPKNKSLDVMIFDTTTRKAYLTRGPEFHLSRAEFNFPAAALAQGAPFQ